MRTPSRKMSPPRPPKTGRAIAVLIAFSALLAYVCWPVLAGLAVLLGSLIIYGYLWGRRRARRIAAERAQESICTFARAFDRRTVDPWVIRAVYEAFATQPLSFPVRADDRLLEDLGADDEDIFYFLGPEIAERAGRSVESVDGNPCPNQDATLRDFVMFLNRQPVMPGPSRLREAQLAAAAGERRQAGARCSAPDPLARPVAHHRTSVGTRHRLCLLALAAFAQGCATGQFSAERFLVSDLLSDPGGSVGLREIPPGTREEQVQALALTLRECIGPDVWTRAGTSLLIDGEALVVRADTSMLDSVRRVLSEMRAVLCDLPAGRGR